MSPSWQRRAAPLPGSVWREVFATGDALDLRVEATDVGGATYHRVLTGPRAGHGAVGAVAVCLAGPAGRRQILLVRQERRAPGVELLELPRGSAEPDDATPVASALRELAEETGVAAESGEDLGLIYTDSGVMAGQVGVVLVTLPGPVETTPQPEEVTAALWLPTGEVAARIAAGEVRDGISLAAVALTSAYLGRSPDRW